MNDAMDVYILDKDFNLITIGIPYVNLQWNRKYYEAGNFQMEISAKIYDKSWAYIGTADRPELGIIQKNQLFGEGDVSVLLGGFFYEKKLDDKVCYPRYVGDAANTETAAREIFTRYKEDLPISLGEPNSPLLGNRTQSDFTDDFLGEKLYKILEARELSYRVPYDYQNNQLFFEVWQGLDRTQSQNVNSHWTFSTEFANIINKSLDFDESAFKNYAVLPVNSDDNGREQDTFYVDFSNGGYKQKIVFDYRANRPAKDQTYADFKQGVIEEATERLLSFAKIEDINIEQAGNAGYMVDYDLGDKCDVLLTDVGISMESRIVEISEVFKAETGHSVTVGLGNKRISNIRRAVSTL